MNKKDTVLIVEDQKINRDILRKMLSDEYKIIEADNGKAAVEIIESNAKIAAVLLDLVMPVMNGFDVLQRLKKSGKSLSLPIIVMTGETDGDYEIKALDSGAWDFVSKPYHPAVIRTRLKNAIARGRIGVLEQVRYISEHDTLTGMYNRRKMFAETVAMVKENLNTEFVFLRLDIDRFRLFNAAYGEDEGDGLLRCMANSITSLTANQKLAKTGHIDADVFCVCEEYDPKTVDDTVEELGREVAKYRPDYMLEISAGAYVFRGGDVNPEKLYVAASLGAEKCKNQFSRRLGYYDELEGRKMAEEEKIVSEMHAAVENKEFVVYYQPKYDLATDNACGAEALVRWLHPKRGLLAPAEFIPIFEKNGFIAELDYYVWEHVCKAMHDWLSAGYRLYPISVNISRVSLYNPNLVERINDLTKKYEIPHDLLQLEITESAYMSNPDLMRKTIDDFRDEGFTILMDDFGSGYSSLNSLKTIRMDILKVDMKFLPVNNEKQNGEIILASVIRMAKWLGMSVVVEGVETEEQKNFLYSIGCNYVQGYFYERPIPEDRFEAEYIKAAVAKRADSEDTEDEGEAGFTSTLLVVDNDELSRKTLYQYFNDIYAVRLSGSVEDAMLYLKKSSHRVRLIMIANNMPGMTGLDFLEYYRSDPVVSWIPKILITDGSDSRDQAMAFERGAYDLITKPFMKELVMARVSHVLAISQQMRSTEKLGEQYRIKANYDSMTGLLNKSVGHELCSRILTAGGERMHALMIMDVDDFKQINDTYGHNSGDAALQCVAKELKETFRQDDILCRFGGDEFVALLQDVSEGNSVRYKVHSLTNQIATAFVQDVKIDGSVSIGLAFSEAGDSYEQLFERADQALYNAKRTGKGKVCVFGETVPPIVDDDKPIILICSENPQLYPTMALAYGDSAAFANVTSMELLKEAFEKYKNRIGVICIDVEKEHEHDSEAFYDFILSNGGGETIPILATYPERSMNMLRSALTLKIDDVFSLPAQMDTVRKKISQCLLMKKDRK